MKEKEWTIMVYMAGDNNLAVDMSYAMEQIKQVAGNDATSPNLFVYYDGNSPSIPTLYCDFSNPENPVYQPSYQITNKLYPPEEIIRNENASDFNSILNFVNWCVNTVEVKNGEEIAHGRRANRYALIISGHSAGFLDKGLFKDESAEKSMSMNYLEELLCRLTDNREELIVKADEASKEFVKCGEPALNAEEYEQETTVLLGKRLSILGFDSCVMGMLEVAYQFSPFTETLIASEGIVPEAGWTYSKILGCLAKNNTLETKKIAERFVIEFIECQDAYKVGGVSVDMAAWDFTPETDADGAIWFPSIDNLVEATGYLSANLIACFAEKDIIYRQMKRILLQVHWKCQSYMFDQNIDLGDFCELLRKECKSLIEDLAEVFSDEQIEFLQNLVKECENVLDKLRKFVIISGYSGGKYQYSNGVSLFFPWSYETFDTVRNNYEGLYFYSTLAPDTKKQSWIAFLDLYLGKVARRSSDNPRKPKQKYNWADFENDETGEELSITPGSTGKLGTGQGRLGTGQGRLGTGQGRLGTGQGRLGTGQGRLGTGQGRLGTGQGRLGTGQGRLNGNNSNAFLDSLETFKNVYTPWNISGFSKETDNSKETDK
ncbi:MAG TPA: clostripain-related cysteine peptidase [Pyrinomonadaceae bacterium]|nr:clostripain-related cysteine peptidase [Pyrinomonadaceae bacterium]